MSAKIIISKPYLWNQCLVFLKAGNRTVRLPDSRGRFGATERGHAIRRARWWSEKTGIPFEQPEGEGDGTLD